MNKNVLTYWVEFFDPNTQEVMYECPINGILEGNNLRFNEQDNDHVLVDNMKKMSKFPIRISQSWWEVYLLKEKN